MQELTRLAAGLAAAGLAVAALAAGLAMSLIFLTTAGGLGLADRPACRPKATDK